MDPSCPSAYLPHHHRGPRPSQRNHVNIIAEEEEWFPSLAQKKTRTKLNITEENSRAEGMAKSLNPNPNHGRKIIGYIPTRKFV